MTTGQECLELVVKKSENQIGIKLWLQKGPLVPPLSFLKEAIAASKVILCNKIQGI